MKKILLLAGDASGDKHAAAFVKSLREQLSDLQCVGLGGVEMQKAGVELYVDQKDIAVGGLVEVLGSTRRLVAAWRRMLRALREERPDLVVLVDAPDFNIPFARRAKRAGVPVLYYISPQVWAWRRGRVRKIARRVDRLAVIFPFEQEVYAGTGVKVDFVGHPLVERTAQAVAQLDPDTARKQLGLEGEAQRVLLLPGSRSNELRHMLPLFLEAARVLQARQPNLEFLLALAPTVSRPVVDERIRAARLPAALRLHVVEGHTYEAVRAADVTLTMPGTMTLEVALLGRPQVVAVQVNALSAWIARRLVRVPWLAMPNLILERGWIPELVQEAATPQAIAEQALALLAGPGREAQLAAAGELREKLGGGGAAEGAAAIALEMLHGAAAS